MNVLVIDYGMGNIGSVRRSFEECGAKVIVSDCPDDLRQVSQIVLPGVGAFAEGMSQLRSRGWVDPLRQATFQDQLPILGICLGMQLLASRGFEGGETEGLGFIDGVVKQLKPQVSSERIPHVGWNEVYPAPNNQLFAGIPDGADFYFVHSFHFLPKCDAHIAARTPYCGQITSAVVAGNICGVQFHPEKSSHVGFQVIRNFLSM